MILKGRGKKPRIKNQEVKSQESRFKKEKNKNAGNEAMTKKLSQKMKFIQS